MTPITYLDLVLLHWPNLYADELNTPQCAQECGEYEFADGRVSQTKERVCGWRHCRRKAWSGLERAVSEGIVRFIGVSNFDFEQHLKPDILDMPGRKYPVYANQIEYHPFVPLHWVETKLQCEKLGIRIIGYGSMGGLLKDSFKEHFHVKRAVTHFNKTMEELFLTWSLNEGVTVIPGTIKRKHLDMSINLEANHRKILGITVPGDERIKAYQPDSFEYRGAQNQRGITE